MSWWGKVLGTAFGFALGGPLGALLGTVVGHQFDKGLKLVTGQTMDREQIQMAFFTATFSVMGRLAKADGRVSRQEISFAQAVMQQMALQPEQKKVAIDLFRQGKEDDFDLEGVLEQFRSVVGRRSTLMRMFLEIQLQAAYADGALHAAERELLIEIFRLLGFSRAEFSHLDAMTRAARDFTGRGPGAAGGMGRAPRKDLLKEAYEVLGVKAEASDAEIKRAYRRLMSQHHPDKLVSRGLPEEMMKIATEKTQEIKNAYEMIKETRGTR
ncbi:co-chaperone DjlA [Thiohalomonas denitrificans]|uniref:co-chaperone DjlA n=1 Tax=Thiohalomonas denitrificans TaxID=415747 RepID=UPI0026EA1C0B|nr:co-chaperone DjlA [Thiohalomonas denitrificans]